MDKIERHKLTFISADKPFTSKAGKDYIKFYIKTEELGEDILLGGFRNQGNRAWKKGDTVDIIVEKSEYNGKDYWNFSNPKAPTANQEQLEKVEKLLLDHLDWHKKQKDIIEEVDALINESEIDPQDLPF